MAAHPRGISAKKKAGAFPLPIASNIPGGVRRTGGGAPLIRQVPSARPGGKIGHHRASFPGRHPRPTADLLEVAKAAGADFLLGMQRAELAAGAFDRPALNHRRGRDSRAGRARPAR
ncbi:hypothetical protein SDC9_20682 [bioreactor metagenome]|uniref:Uncharacterized protein n=1 Tax=bioreactor metagenome TaxID=1076179 RepID=A0A644U7K4_9ZZZZ